MHGIGLPIGMHHRQRTALREALLSIARSSQIAFWPFDEASGTSATDRSGNARNGAYAGTYTLNQAGVIPADGAGAVAVAGAGYVNLYSTSLRDAWSKDEHTLAIWVRASAAGDWSDSTARHILSLGTDGNNQSYLRKNATTNQIRAAHVAGGSAAVVDVVLSAAPSDWFHLALTSSKAAGLLKLFYNGAQVGASATNTGTWSGVLASNLCAALASSTSPGSPWKGRGAMAGLYSSILTPVQIARLALCRGFVVYDGDSRMVGTGVPVPQQAHQLAGLLARQYGFQNIAVSGQTALQCANDIASQGGALVWSAWKNVAVLWAGVNDAAAGADAATIWARMQAWAQAARTAGFQKIILCTEIDAQDANRNAVGWHATLYPALNTLIRAGYSAVADGIADLGANAALQDATNTTYFNADKVHLIAAGNAVAAGIIAAAVAGV